MKGQPKLAKIIRERRVANGLSQQELAVRLDISQPQISLWEQARSKPSEKQIKALERILGGITREEEREVDSQSPISAWLARGMAKRNKTATELAREAGLSVPTIYNLLSGRAENPHPGTIQSIEAALKEKFDSGGETNGTNGLDAVGELIDFNPHDPKEIPNLPGVYVFYDISQRPIYVGQAANIADRVKDHHEKFWFKRPIVELGAYVEIKDKTLRNQVETVLIQFLKSNAVINKNKIARD